MTTGTLPRGPTHTDSAEVRQAKAQAADAVVSARVAATKAIDAASAAASAVSQRNLAEAAAVRANTSAVAAASAATVLASQLAQAATSADSATQSATQAGIQATYASASAVAAANSANNSATIASSIVASANLASANAAAALVSQNASAVSAAAALVSQTTAATSVTSSATSATNSAASAASSAASAVLASQTFTGTSTSTLTIALGTQSFTTNTNKSWTPGQSITIAYSNTQEMFGNIISYNSSNGAMSVAVSTLRGAGTYSVWSIGLSPYASGTVPGVIAYFPMNANYQANTWDGVLSDTTAGTFTVQAPTGQAVGATFVVGDGAGTWGTNKLIVTSADATFANQDNFIHLDLAKALVTFIWSGVTWNVYCQVFISGVQGVTLTDYQTLSNKVLTASTASLTALSVSADATISGLTIGVGAGGIATNTALGKAALSLNTSGSNNVGVGLNANKNNATGTDNTALGANALLINTGTGNLALGSGAGSGITTGTNNVVIGGYTGAGGPIAATYSNYVVISDGSGAIKGYYDPSGNLNVTGTIRSAGNLTLNSANVGTYALPIGGGALTGPVSVAGRVTSTTGGYAFPDGSVQLVAAVSNATGGGGDKLFINTIATMTASYSLPANASSFVNGPLTMNPGISLTLPAGTRLRVF